jgi:hypothetical protein
MLWRGLEPPRPNRALAPQASVSTNSTTTAICRKRIMIPKGNVNRCAVSRIECANRRTTLPDARPVRCRWWTPRFFETWSGLVPPNPRSYRRRTATTAARRPRKSRTCSRAVEARRAPPEPAASRSEILAHERKGDGLGCEAACRRGRHHLATRRTFSVAFQVL